MVYTERRKVRAGFTLIEIMIAITVIGVLGAILVPSLYYYVTKSKRTSTEANLRAVQTSIDQFYLDTNDYPGKPRDLIKKPADEKLAKRWQGPYLKSNETPTDGWGNTLYYKKPGEKGHPYELSSYGEHGKGSPKNEWISVWDL